MGGDHDQLKAMMNALLEGDRLVWGALKEQLSRYVDLRCAALPIDRENLVADIIQTVLSNLREDRFKGTCLKMLYGYIYGIARLKVLRAVRSAASAGALRRESDQDADGVASPDNPERSVANKDLADKIFAALDPRSRELLMLRFLEGWSEQEIADHMRMTKNAVATAISRAIRRAQDFDFVRGIM